LSKLLSDWNKACFIDGEEHFANLCRRAAVAVRSFIFNTVGSARRLNTLVVLLEADRVGVFVVIAPRLLQTVLVGIAGH
jgi:hypothetical protein